MALTERVWRQVRMPDADSTSGYRVISVSAELCLTTDEQRLHEAIRNVLAELERLQGMENRVRRLSATYPHTGVVGLAWVDAIRKALEGEGDE